MEIIIGDDGSSDDSISVIQELEERYPGIIRHYVMDRNDGVNIPSVRVSNNKKGIIRCAGKVYGRAVRR